MLRQFFTKVNLVWFGIALAVVALGVIYVYLPRSGEQTNSPDTNSASGPSITMIEYADLMCESCMNAHQNTLPKIKRQYVETGKIDYSIKLVNKIAPDSLRAAQGALCAKTEGKYIEYIEAAYNRLATDFHNRGVLPAESTIYQSATIGELADTIGINRATFEQCVESGLYADEVIATTEEFDALERVYGTPHFIIDGKGYTGAPPYEVFKATIEEAL